MNAIKSFFSWIADLFRTLFGKKHDEEGEKPSLCGVSAKNEEGNKDK